MDIERISQARLLGRPGTWELTFTSGRITSVSQSATSESAVLQPVTVDGTFLDVGGRLVVPPLVEPHVHLDTALTAGDPTWNASGTLFEGVQRWAERKPKLTHVDVIERASKAVQWQVVNGVQFIRTHCDTTDASLTALYALLELKERLAPIATIQIVAFPQEGIVSFPRGQELLEEALRLGADAVGATPHLEFTRDDGVTAVKCAFELAERYDRLVDIHCDEIDDEQSRFLEVVAAETYRRGMGARVTASHTTAMGSYNDAYTYKLMHLLKLADLSFVANPLVNIHLQGRFDGYPKRRGLTRVKELLAAGLTVCFGHDDLCDPWYPLGTADMLQVLHMGLHVCQLMGYSELCDSLKLITTHSARALALGEGYGIEPTRPANVVVLDAGSQYDAVRKRSAILYSIRNGRVIARTQPSQSWVDYGNGESLVNFDHVPPGAS